jgi:hypothetical protein
MRDAMLRKRSKREKERQKIEAKESDEGKSDRNNSGIIQEE